VREGQGHRGSTPLTSTIFPSEAERTLPSIALATERFLFYRKAIERDGKWFRIDATPVGFLSTGTAVVQSLVTKGGFTATAWKDAQFAYALVTDEGVEALRQQL